MSVWSEDPELLATFQAEVQERLASLGEGLLQLEATPKARSLLQTLLRDAHTLKGSARMLGLQELVELVHGLEEVLVAVRDGRSAVTRDLVDVLLAACDCIGRGAPGGDLGEGAPELAAMVAALAAALQAPALSRTAPPVRVIGLEPPAPPAPPLPPPLLSPPTAAPASKPAVAAPAVLDVPTVAPAAVPTTSAGNGGAASELPAPVPVATLRVALPKVRELLDAIEEAEHGARRVDTAMTRAREAVAEIERWTQAISAEVPRHLTPGLATAVMRLRAATASVAEATAVAGDVAQDHSDRVVIARDRALALAMVPLRQVVLGYPSLVRRLAADIGADVDLRLVGEEVELDKRVLDAVSEALGHLVTNAVDHGCATPAVRRAAGRPDRCTVSVTARTAGANVVITVADDGAGVDLEALRRVASLRNLVPAEGLSEGALLDLLFHPGLSTRATVGATSGRGVGLDIVRSSVLGVGGSVTVESSAETGTCFTVILPVSLGVLHCLVARLGAERYAIPVTSIQETVSLKGLPVDRIGGSPSVVRDGVSLPLLDLAATVGAAGTATLATGLIAAHPQGPLLWAVDEVVGESDIVVRDLGGFLADGGGVPGVAGATFDGDGNVLCLLDLRELAEVALGAPLTSPVASAAPATGVPAPRVSAETTPARVLVVEDSVGVRELERAVLTQAGYDVTTCIDGLEAATHLADAPVDLVLSDVEMPGMTGIELTRLIRRTDAWAQVPVVLMTSLSGEEDRRAGMTAGASAYLLKSAFAPAELVATVRRLVGR